MKIHHVFSVLLLITTSNLWAQRETFEATSTRRVEVLIVELENIASAGAGANRMERVGATADGQRMAFQATRQSQAYGHFYFKLDSDQLLNDTARLQVKNLAMALNSERLGATRFLIEGHTCDLGESEHNRNLSARRAETIRRLLIEDGVSPDRLAALGFGETEIVEPVSTDDSVAAAETKRQKSRRVVLRKILPVTPSRKK
jgi:outer membrane protein OmpA-like peptidoglycan-associated protein